MKQLAAICLLFLFIIESMAQFVTVGTLSSNLVDPNKNYTSVPPTWLTSPYFRAGSQAVITTLTGNDQTPVFTFTFSSPLTGIPNLAYGIKNYRGKPLGIQAMTIWVKNSSRSRRSAFLRQRLRFKSRFME
jgi:hypothetical protein